MTIGLPWASPEFSHYLDSVFILFVSFLRFNEIWVNFFSFTNLCAERLNILNYNTPVHHPQRLLVRPQCQLLSLEPRYPEFLEYIKTESANWPALGHSLLLHHSPFLWHPVWKDQLKVLARGIWKKILILPIFVWCIKWQKDYLEHRRGPATVLMGP